MGITTYVRYWESEEHREEYLARSYRHTFSAFSTKSLNFDGENASSQVYLSGMEYCRKAVLQIARIASPFFWKVEHMKHQISPSHVANPRIKTK